MAALKERVAQLEALFATAVGAAGAVPARAHVAPAASAGATTSSSDGGGLPLRLIAADYFSEVRPPAFRVCLMDVHVWGVRLHACLLVGGVG